MNKEIENLKNKFNEIKNIGWIKSKYKDTGSIGVTFEKLLGIEENYFEIPDYNGIELKTKSAYSNSYTNLFNCKPTGLHYLETKRLKELYGYPDKVLKKFKVLNTSVTATKKNKVGLWFYFILKVDNNLKKIFLLVYDTSNKLIENCVYWDFDILEEKLYRKLQTLAFVKALVKQKNNQKYFKYYDIKFYKLKNFETFINLIENGIIRINFKIGIFKSGEKLGHIHDHGTSFNINECDLTKLYNLIKL